MPGGRFAPDIVEGWMDDIDAMSIWLGLCFSDPYLVGDPRTVEIAGGTYARVASIWGRTDTNMMTLTASAKIHGLPPDAVVQAVVGWNSQFGAGIVFRDMLETPKEYPSGGTYVIPANEYVIGIDV